MPVMNLPTAMPTKSWAAAMMAAPMARGKLLAISPFLQRGNNCDSGGPWRLGSKNRKLTGLQNRPVRQIGVEAFGRLEALPKDISSCCGWLMRVFQRDEEPAQPGCAHWPGRSQGARRKGRGDVRGEGQRSIYKRYPYLRPRESATALPLRAPMAEPARKLLITCIVQRSVSQILYCQGKLCRQHRLLYCTSGPTPLSLRPS